MIAILNLFIYSGGVSTEGSYRHDASSSSAGCNSSSNGQGNGRLSNHILISLKIFILYISLQLEFGSDWTVPLNVFVLQIAQKGSGKSPTNGTFVRPLEKIEQSAMKTEMSKRKRLSSTGGAGDKRPRGVQDMILSDQEEDSTEDEDPEIKSDVRSTDVLS